MQFDYVYMVGKDYRYGYVKGNDTVVFIKAGLGGDCFGYENKYLKIARSLNDKYGVSVICASNPQDNRSHIDVDRQIIEQYISENGFTSPTLYLVGVSNGGIKGLELNSGSCRFNKMLLVNMPLMINFHKTKKFIQDEDDTKIILAYGSKDPSFSYIPYIEGRFDNVQTVVVEGADHNFKGMLDRFSTLIEKLMEE